MSSSRGRFDDIQEEIQPAEHATATNNANDAQAVAFPLESGDSFDITVKSQTDRVGSRKSLLGGGSLAEDLLRRQDTGDLPEDFATDVDTWLSFFERQFAEGTRLAAASIDHTMQAMRLERRNRERVNCNPIYLLLRMPLVKASLFILSAWYLYLFVAVCQVLAHGHSLRASSITVTVLSLRNESLTPSLVNIGTVTVSHAHDACDTLPMYRLQAHEAVEERDHSRAIITLSQLDEEAHVAGWTFTTIGNDVSLDPVQFSVSLSHKGTTRRLPAHDFRIGFLPRQQSSYTWTANPPDERGATVSLSPLPPAVHSCTLAVLFGVLAAGGLLGGGLAVTWHLLAARVVLCSAGLVAGVASAFAGAVLVAEGEGALALSWLRAVLSAVVVLPCAGINQLQHSVAPSLLVGSVLHLVLFAVDCGSRARQAGERVSVAVAVGSEEPCMCVLGAVTALVLTVRLRMHLARLRAEVKEVHERHQKAWEEDCAVMGPDLSSALLNLAHAVTITTRGLRGRPQQRLGDAVAAHSLAAHTDGPGRGGAGHGLPGWGSTAVRSLDQLYGQARGGQLLLRAKVKSLAMQSHGMFFITQRRQYADEPDFVAASSLRGAATSRRSNASRNAADEVQPDVDAQRTWFIKWEDASKDPELAGLIRWTSLKQPARAVYKAIHYYDGDVSKLTDVCRETIVFSRISDITTCLYAMKHDQDVHIEHIHSSMGQEEAVMDMRKVEVLVRIVSGAAKALGLDGHVFEVQLVTEGMARAAADDQAARLRRLRDATISKDSASAWAAWLLARAATAVKSAGTPEASQQQRDRLSSVATDASVHRFLPSRTSRASAASSHSSGHLSPLNASRISLPSQPLSDSSFARRARIPTLNPTELYVSVGPQRKLTGSEVEAGLARQTESRDGEGARNHVVNAGQRRRSSAKRRSLGEVPEQRAVSAEERGRGKRRSASSLRRGSEGVELGGWGGNGQVADAAFVFPPRGGQQHSRTRQASGLWGLQSPLKTRALLQRRQRNSEGALESEAARHVSDILASAHVIKPESDALSGSPRRPAGGDSSLRIGTPRSVAVSASGEGGRRRAAVPEEARARGGAECLEASAESSEEGEAGAGEGQGGQAMSHRKEEVTEEEEEGETDLLRSDKAMLAPGDVRGGEQEDQREAGGRVRSLVGGSHGKRGSGGRMLASPLTGEHAASQRAFSLGGSMKGIRKAEAGAEVRRVHSLTVVKAPLTAVKAPANGGAQRGSLFSVFGKRRSNSSVPEVKLGARGGGRSASYVHHKTSLPEEEELSFRNEALMRRSSSDTFLTIRKSRLMGGVFSRVGSLGLKQQSVEGLGVQGGRTGSSGRLSDRNKKKSWKGSEKSLVSENSRRSSVFSGAISRLSSIFIRTKSFQLPGLQQHAWQGGSGGWYELVERLFKERMLGQARRLDDKQSSYSVAMRDAEELAVLSTSSPIAAALSKDWFLLACLAVGLAYTIAAGIAVADLSREGHHTAQSVAVSLHKSSEEANRAALGESVRRLGLHYGACSAELFGEVTESERTDDGVRLVFDLGMPAAFTGLYWETAGGKDWKPDLIVLETSSTDASEEEAEEGGRTWGVVGSSQRLLAAGGHQVWVDSLSQEGGPTWDSNEVVEVDLRAPWFLWLDGAGSPVILAMTWLSLVLCGVLDRISLTGHLLPAFNTLSLGRPALSLGLLVSAACHVTSAAAGLAGRYAGQHALRWVVACLEVVEAGVVSVRPQRMVEAMTACKLSTAVALAGWDMACGRGEFAHVVVPFLLGILGLVLLCAMKRSRWVSLKQVEHDMAAYEAAWARQWEGEGADTGLFVVAHEVEAIQRRLIGRAAPAQRYNPMGAARARKDPRGRRANAAGLTSKFVRAASDGAGQVSAIAGAWGRSKSQDESSCAYLDGTVHEAGSPPHSPQTQGRLTAAEGMSVTSLDAASTASAGRSPRSVTSGALRNGAPSPHASFRSGRLLPAFSNTDSALEGIGGGEGGGEGEGGGDGGAGIARGPSLGLRGWVSASDLTAGDLTAGDLTASAHDLPPFRLRNLSAVDAHAAGGQRTHHKIARLRSTEFNHTKFSSSVSIHKIRNDVHQKFKRGGAKAMRVMGLSMVSRPVAVRAGGLPVLEAESLDQLYLQAEGLTPILKAKVLAWAEACDGCFFVSSATPDSEETPLQPHQHHHNPHHHPNDAQPAIRPWAELVAAFGRERAAGMVKWAKLKSPERAIEKVVRSYGGKVCRLLDVCRQSLICASPEHVAACLFAIRSDTQVKILNVKNRLQKSYDARALSLGYRDVNLSLRIDTPATRRLGIHLHVCEVQLLLSDFAVLKSDKGHKRYVAFRNARGS